MKNNQNKEVFLQDLQQPDKAYEKAMIEAFINKPEKTLWYQNAFLKCDINKNSDLTWVWSWWAVFGGWAFLLYRKQYIPALVLFVISILAGAIPLGGLLVSTLAGGYSTYFIYKGYKSKKRELETNIPDMKARIKTMRTVGGYHQWVVVIYAIYVAIISFYLFSMIATLLTII
jgi:hypothetical protein